MIDEGTIIGDDLRIDSVIAAGGMGVVYRADRDSRNAGESTAIVRCAWVASCIVSAMFAPGR